MAEISVIFVDVRGFTAMSERLPPREMVEKLNLFYNLAAQEVFALDGTLDKLVGDEVMAFFGAPFRPEDHPVRAVQAALNIVAGVEGLAGDGDGLEVGAGVATGETYMGNVAEGEVRDFTVIGDTVNTAARLQQLAQPGEILMTEDTYQHVIAQYPGIPQRILEVRGKAEPVKARVLSSGAR